MATISLTLPQSGTVVTAGLHSSNYGTLQSTINGGLDNNNFSTGKIFDPAKLMQNGALDQQVLGWNNAAQQWQPKGGSYRKTTVKTVNTSTSATDLLNGEVTVGAGVLGTTGAVRLKAWGDRLQNSGGTAALPRFQVVFGGSTLLDTGTPGGLESASAARTNWQLEATILNTATNAQVVSLFLSVGSQGGIAAGTSGFTTGTGVYQNLYTGATSVMAQASGSGAGAVDTTAAKALVLNVINGSANAAYETKLFGAIVEVI